MGRGIVESGLFRSERYQLERRTSDPATTQEGEMWIRTDLAPDADQLATLRFDAGGSVWDVPIYDVSASTDNVAKAWRLQVNGATGFVPITDTAPTYDALKYQHNGAVHAAHDALKAIGQPASGISRWTFDDDDTSSSTAVDVWDGYDGTINGATTGVSGANQTYTTDEAYSFDGSNDVVDGTLGWSPSFPLSVAAWVRTTSTSTSGVMGLGSNATGSEMLWINVQGDGNLKVAFYENDKAEGFAANLNDGAWHHVVGVYKSDGTQIGYADGSQLGSNDPGTVSYSGDAAFRIGRGRTDYSYYMDGRVDDPRVYSKDLSATEVSNLYNTGSIEG